MLSRAGQALNLWLVYDPDGNIDMRANTYGDRITKVVHLPDESQKSEIF